MRKIRRKKPITVKKLLLAFIISLTVISIGYSKLSTNLEIKGKSSLVVNNEEEDLKIEYQKQYWGENPYTYQFNVTLTNTSTSPKSNWTLSIPMPSDAKLVSFWSVKAQIVDGNLILKNEDYNGEIKVDESVSFGIQIETSQKGFELKEGMDDSTEVEEEPSDTPSGGIKNVEITYKKDSSWPADGGYYIMYTVDILNKGDRLTEWTLKINKPSSVKYANSWNVNYVEQEDMLVFSNVSYNGVIEKDQSISFQFQVFSPTEDYDPTTKLIREIY